MIEAFDQLIGDSVMTYVKVSNDLNRDVGHQATIVEALFRTQRDFLLSSVGTRSPSAGAGPLQVSNDRPIDNPVVYITQLTYVPIPRLGCMPFKRSHHYKSSV